MQEEKKKHDWVDLILKAITPLVAGLLIAWAGYVSNLTLSSVESHKENARLITELQLRDPHEFLSNIINLLCKC